MKHFSQKLFNIVCKHSLEKQLLTREIKLEAFLRKVHKNKFWNFSYFIRKQFFSVFILITKLEGQFLHFANCNILGNRSVEYLFPVDNIQFLMKSIRKLLNFTTKLILIDGQQIF